MKGIKRGIRIVLGVCVMLTLFGCGKPKHKLLFAGLGFQSDKSAYAAGEKVTVTYGLIATDTDYRFWLDDESVELDRDYDDERGFVFSFTMPDHDVTLHVEHHNSMAVLPAVCVSFRNEAAEADVWVLPQTEANRKTSLWGTPSVAGLGVGETAELRLPEAEGAERWLVRIIDSEQGYYSAQDLMLDEGFTIVFRCEGSRTDAVIEVLDQNGALVSSAPAFTGVLGGG